VVSRLRELRESAILTVRELSQESGVSEDAITKIENGYRKARPSTIRRLAKALGVEPHELMAPRQEASHAREANTVEVARDVYWNVLEAAKGHKTLEPDELREATEVLMIHG
jgi:transcriptional regulator with XRE-family HTH domain